MKNSIWMIEKKGKFDKRFFIVGNDWFFTRKEAKEEIKLLLASFAPNTICT